MNAERNNKITYTKRNLLMSSLFVFLITFLLSGKSFASEINTENVVKLVNLEREERGLPMLKVDSSLTQAASLKTKDMLNRNYFEHRAFGMSPWDFIKLSGYDYLYAGENLAMDFNTSEGMVNAWMNSPAHRDNILNSDYTEMGIGVVKGEYTENGASHSTTLVTNMFGRKKPAIVKLFDYIAKNVFSSY